LVEQGNSVVIIEHNLDVIKSADWIIDLGPEGGEKGGQLMFEGTPEEMIKIKDNYTASFLKEKFD
jgi:excinuclease ABC subunit A